MIDFNDDCAIPVADRDTYDAATALIAAFGTAADIEAATRAHASRVQGNLLHFSRWRQIERLIPLLTCNGAIGTVH